MPRAEKGSTSIRSIFPETVKPLEIESALKLGRAARGPERHLEAARDERQAQVDLSAKKQLEVAAERAFELEHVHLRKLEAHLPRDRLAQAFVDELDGLVKPARVDRVRSEPLREAGVE